MVFAKSAVGGEAVGAVALVDGAVVEPVVVARGVHARAAALALAAARVDLDSDALADFVLVNAGPERRDRAHVFMAGREVFVERHAALNHCGRAVRDDFQIGRADRDGVDAHQHLGALRHRHGLFGELQLARLDEHPRAHGVGHGHVLRGLHAGRCIHPFVSFLFSRDARAGTMGTQIGGESAHG